MLHLNLRAGVGAAGPVNPYIVREVELGVEAVCPGERGVVIRRGLEMVRW